MPHYFVLLFVLLLPAAGASATRAQSPSQPTPGGATLLKHEAPCTPGQLAGVPDADDNLDVSIVMKGVEGGPWRSTLRAQVKKYWHMPYEAIQHKGRVVVTFRVAKDGTIEHAGLKEPSSVAAFNESALTAVTCAKRTAPLPAAYPDDFVDVTFSFYYNEIPATEAIRPESAPVNPPPATVGSAATATPAVEPAATGLVLVVDVKGADFSPWVNTFTADVKRRWFIPWAARKEKGHVVVTFWVTRDGTIENLALKEPSATRTFNDAALAAVARVGKTAPLPAAYPDDRALFTVTFYYNESHPQ